LTNKNLANFISLSRILGVVVIFWLTPYKTNLWQLWVVLIYIVICITDFFDGWVARRLGIVSDIGKVLDPLADKIVVLVLLPLLEMQVISSFPVFIILAREFAIMGLRVVSAKNGVIIAATKSGKIKTILTLPVCGILLGRAPVTEVANLPLPLVPLNLLRRWVFSWPGWVFNLLIWSVVIVTVWSFLDYFGTFIWQQYVNKAGNDAKQAKKQLLSIVPTTITTLNMICGFAGIIFCFLGYYDLTVLLVLTGLIFDGLDGNIARKLGVSSGFGAKLDSRADTICFGLAPAVLIYFTLSSYNFASSQIVAALFGALYPLSVIYRLKRFDKKGHSDYFEGLPSPIAASFIVLGSISSYIATPLFFMPIIIISCILMVSRVKYPHSSITLKKPFFKFLKIPASVFFMTTLLSLLDKKIGTHLFFSHEALFLVAVSYIAYPLTYLLFPPKSK
jgi:CDP-diacylglycerol--glycerol-3-phosphate 3-phosphatidyltransferase/CDP-diacylglycerol--serine O-phosphatidyltransferase